MFNWAVVIIIVLIFAAGFLVGMLVSNNYYSDKYRKIAYKAIEEVHNSYSDAIPTQMEEYR